MCGVMFAVIPSPLFAIVFWLMTPFCQPALNRVSSARWKRQTPPHPSWRQADAFSLHSFGVNPPAQALHYAETEGLCRSSITLTTNSYPVSTPP